MFRERMASSGEHSMPDPVPDEVTLMASMSMTVCVDHMTELSFKNAVRPQRNQIEAIGAPYIHTCTCVSVFTTT